MSVLRAILVDLPMSAIKAAGLITVGTVGAAGWGTAATVQAVQANKAKKQPTLPPAGWYVDPNDLGLMRWWDGQQYTAITTQNGQQRRYAPAALPPAGWYRDKDQPTMLQWWDGQDWTGVVRAASDAWQEAEDDTTTPNPFEAIGAEYDQQYHGE